MKRYKLLKDLPTFKAGEEFTLSEFGDLVCPTQTVYSASTLEKFPNILRDWFEEISEKTKTIWELKDGDICWGVASNNNIVKPILIVYKSKEHENLRNIGSLWLNLKGAQDYIEFSKAEQILKRSTKGFKPDYSDGGNTGIIVSYSEGAKMLECYDGGDRNGTLRFATREDAEASITHHRQEWLTYLGVEENE